MLTPFAAGDTINLTVQRDGATLNVSLTLANRAALSGVYAPPSHTLHPRFADEWAAQRKRFAWPADAEAAAVAPPAESPAAIPTVPPPRTKPAP